MKKNYYSVLGVSENATEKEIKTAYKNLARKYHPDVNSGNKEYEEKFKEISEAYSIIGDKEKRYRYDHSGDMYNNVGFGFDDLFGEYFNTRRQSQNLGDLRINIQCSLEELYNGTKKRIVIKKKKLCKKCKGNGSKNGTEFKTCDHCGGAGRQIFIKETIVGNFRYEDICRRCNGTGKIIKEVCDYCGGNGFVYDESEIAIDIPHGFSHGEGMVMRGGGEDYFGDEYHKGDLYITVLQIPHKDFIRKGNDIYKTEEVNAYQAIIGDKIKIKTIDGEIVFKLPEGTQYGANLKINGKGMKKKNSEDRGDMIIQIKVIVPINIKEEEKKLIKEIIKQRKMQN